MRKLIQRLIGLGADISTKRALKTALKTIGAREENVDKIYIELKNSINREAFLMADPGERMLILPACLRNSKKCRAKLTDEGYKCVMCGACKIKEIKEEAERMGCSFYVVPGGSMALDLVRKKRPRAVLGVACLGELVSAAESLTLPIQGVQLLRSGCVDTDVDAGEVISTLRGNEKQLNKGDK